MTNEEKHILDKVGNDNPFRVPDGYFAELQANLMKNIPAGKAKTVKLHPHRRFMWPMVSAAASVCIAIFAATAYFYNKDNNAPLANKSEMASAKAVFDEELRDMISSDVEGAEEYITMTSDEMYKYIAEYY